MRKLIFILLAFISLASYGQTKQTIKQLTVKDSLTINAGNPAANKIATSIDGNGRFRWVYFSDFQDSINTGVYDTSNVNVLDANSVKVNRDSFTDPAATIASIGDSGFIVQCAASCDDIRWTTINGTQTVLKDSTDNVGIGTSNPSAKLHVVGSVLTNTNLTTIQNSLLTGTDLYPSPSSDTYTGLSIQGYLPTDTNEIIYQGAFYESGNQFLQNIVGSYNKTQADDQQDYISVSRNNIRLLVQSSSVQNSINIEDSIIGIASKDILLEATNRIQINIPSAATGYILTSDALGNATWQDHNAYGEMGFGDSTRTIALTQNVFSVVTNSNNTLWQTAAVDLHNVTYSGDSLIIDSAGTYQVNVQLSMDGTSGSVIRLGVFLNGVLACSCTGYQELLNNRILQLTYINIDALNAGDVLQVVITNTANNDDVDAVGGKLMVNKIR
jgi:hypothetical protein